MPSLLLSLAFGRFSQFAGSWLCDFLVRIIPFRIGLFFPFLLPISGSRDKTSGFPAMSPKSICTIPLLVVLVISPIQTTCDLKSSKTLFLSYGTASVGVVLYQISNTGGGSNETSDRLVEQAQIELSWQVAQSYLILTPLIGRIIYTLGSAHEKFDV